MKLITAFVMVTVGCFVALSTVGAGWIGAFARTEQPLIYVAVYSLLMFASLCTVQRVAAKTGRWSRAIALVVLGELSSVMALGVSIATHPEILNRLSNTMGFGSLLDTLVAVLFSSLFLGGWLLTPIGAVVAEMLARCRGSE